MDDVPLYVLRLLQYFALMLAFGLPLLQWQSIARLRHDNANGTALPPETLRRWLLFCLAFAFMLNQVEAPLKTMSTLWLTWTELDAEALAWYVMDTAMGWAWLARGTLLLSGLVLLAAWPRWRGPPIRILCLVAAAALLSLLWNGHAAASPGTAGWLRLGLGGLHLLAAAAWLGAIVGFMIMLANDWPMRGEASTLQRWHGELHAFSGIGTLLVVVLLVSGAIHYAWILEWQWSAQALSGTEYGRWMLFKLALFAAMLVLAALHRWVLVPRLSGQNAAKNITVLRRSLRLEAVCAGLIVLAIAILGTMSPHG